MQNFPWHRRGLALIMSTALLACAPAMPIATTPTAGSRAGDAPLNSADRARQTLSRLTFGARAGDMATIERMGVNAWVDLQLHPERIPDHAADSVLDRLAITHKTAFELFADYPQPNEFGLSIIAPVRPAVLAAAAALKADSVIPLAALAAVRAQTTQTNVVVTEALKLNQARTAATRELLPAILLRATLSDRQLLEVMTNFWENHFSVSSSKVPNPFSLVDYDRAIRAHALGKFRDLLGAVATSPTMLFYLDNYQSFVDSLHPNPVEWQVEARRAANPPLGDTAFVHTLKRRRGGNNENYARELMELHTMGVDGGYTQHDVQEVARCLTGWGIDNVLMGGTFAFQAAQHDAGEKVVLGVHIPGGRGIEDGQQVLDILARHPATAHFIARKLVIHFVSDSAPPALVERAAQTYLHTEGDIAEVMRTIITSPEFNSRAAYRAKVKTPFELVASLVRVMNAAPDTTQATAQLAAQLGQPIFGRLTPDGWPDQAIAWMNTGALLNRLNLANRVGNNQVPTIALAKWAPVQTLLTATPEQQVDGLIVALLAGDALPQTRTAMLESQTAPGTLPHLRDLVSIALGSSDFQKR